MAENEWTDELKQKVVDAYMAHEPTPDTTMDIVKEVADEVGKTANGVRMILTKANVYVKKVVGSTTKTSGDKAARVNKTEAIATLKKAIEDMGKEVDDDIVDRFTGKAAVYLAGLLG